MHNFYLTPLDSTIVANSAIINGYDKAYSMNASLTKSCDGLVLCVINCCSVAS